MPKIVQKERVRTEKEPQEKGTPKGGKGKGQQAADGKNPGKGGPKGGCWNCGGNHYAQNCPKGKGKGGKAVPAYYMGTGSDEDWSTGSGEAVRPLSCIRQVPNFEHENQYGALDDTEEINDATVKDVLLADWIEEALQKHKERENKGAGRDASRTRGKKVREAEMTERADVKIPKG